MFQAPLCPASGAHDDSVGYHIGISVQAGWMSFRTEGLETHPFCLLSFCFSPCWWIVRKIIIGHTSMKTIKAKNIFTCPEILPLFCGRKFSLFQNSKDPNFQTDKLELCICLQLKYFLSHITNLDMTGIWKVRSF